MIDQIEQTTNTAPEVFPQTAPLTSQTVSHSRFADSLSPAMDTRPVAFNALGHLLLVAALAVWALLVAPVRDFALAAVGLLVIAGLARLAVDFRISRGNVSQRSGVAVANLVLLVGVGAAGLAGMTLLSPVVLVLPAIVWSTAALMPKPWISNLVTRLAVLFVAGIGYLGTTDRAETPLEAVPTIIFAASLIVATLLVWLHGRRSGPKLTEATVEESVTALGRQDESPLAQVRAAITGQPDAAGIARVAARSIRERFNPEYVSIVEHVPHSNLFQPLAEIVGDTATVDLGRRLAGITESALGRSQPIWMMDDADDTYTVTCRRLGIQAALIVPLVHLSHRVGAIQIAWSQPVGPLALSEALSYVTELSTMITPDLAIAQFASEIERGYFDAISALAAHVDDRDDFTRGHSRRVAKHALTIAEALDLEEGQQRMLLYAAELHDIGRIGVSEQILTKTDALSPADWAEIRSYPRISADIVEPLSFFTDVREIVLHQGERWDGKGYPNHLAGMDIPLLSRILAVADAYDAMTSPRAYRSAMSPQAALTELWRARGTRYDPEVVEAFVMSGNLSQRIA